MRRSLLSGERSKPANYKLLTRSRRGLLARASSGNVSRAGRGWLRFRSRHSGEAQSMRFGSLARLLAVAGLLGTAQTAPTIPVLAAQLDPADNALVLDLPDTRIGAPCKVVAGKPCAWGPIRVRCHGLKDLITLTVKGEP